MTDTDCTALFDFSQADSRDAWAVQNDTVMGGNSLGTLSRISDALIFKGDLVTRDGGFVQINARLPEGALEGMRSLRVIGLSEGRRWRARVETDERVPRSAGRAAVDRSGPDYDGPLVAFSAALEGLGTNEFAAATAAFGDPERSSRGRPVPGAAWNSANATSLGLILADGRDGPFRLAVSRIEVCR